MQFGCTAHHAALDIGDDDRAIVSAFCGIVFDETVIHEAMETVVTAFRIESQEMIAQQRQFFLLTQRADGALREGRTRNVLVVHSKTPLGRPSRRRRIPRQPILCIAA
jgi:hypothetical protein